MSFSKIVNIDEFIRFTARTDGRDKIYRTIQYASRFLAWYYIRKRLHGQLQRPVQILQNLELLMSTTRKGMRLGRFINFSKKLLESFHVKNRRIGTICGLLATCQGLFMLLDNLLLLNRFKIIHLLHPDRLQEHLNQVWLLWLCLALTRDYYEIQATLAVGQHHQQKHERAVARQTNLILANKPLIIDTIKNLCDIYLPLSNLGIVRANPAIQGLAGTISSVLGLIQLWDIRYQLPS